MFLHLGSGLRNWVFIPITTICVSLLMKYLSYIFNQGSKKVIQSDTKNVDNLDFNAEMGKRALDMKIKNAIKRASLLKSNFMYISKKDSIHVKPSSVKKKQVSLVKNMNHKETIY